MDISEATPVTEIAAQYNTTTEIIQDIIDHAHNCWKGINNHYSIIYGDGDGDESFDVSLGCENDPAKPRTVWDLVSALLEHIDSTGEWSDYPERMCSTAGFAIRCRSTT